MVERGAARHIATARMSDQMNVMQPHRPDEVRDVLDDGSHRIVLDPPGPLGIALAEKVEREHASELRNPLEVPAPVGGAISISILEAGFRIERSERKFVDNEPRDVGIPIVRSSHNVSNSSHYVD